MAIDAMGSANVWSASISSVVFFAFAILCSRGKAGNASPVRVNLKARVGVSNAARLCKLNASPAIWVETSRKGLG